MLGRQGDLAAATHLEPAVLSTRSRDQPYLTVHLSADHTCPLEAKVLANTFFRSREPSGIVDTIDSIWGSSSAYCDIRSFALSTDRHQSNLPFQSSRRIGIASPGSLGEYAVKSERRRRGAIHQHPREARRAPRSPRAGIAGSCNCATYVDVIAFILKRIFRKPGLALLTVLSIALPVGVLNSVPLFSGAVDRAVLREEMSDPRHLH